jgi:hypothetical protein
LEQLIEERIQTLSHEGQSSVLIAFIEKAELKTSPKWISLGRVLLKQLLSASDRSGQTTSALIKQESSIETKKSYDQSNAETMGLAALLVVNDGKGITASDQLLLRRARVKFPKVIPLWLSGSLANNITKRDIEVGRAIYTNTTESSLLRSAVALALSSLDLKARIFYRKQVEAVLSGADKKEKAISTSDSSKLTSAANLKLLLNFYSTLSYIGWLRFYRAPDALSLSLKCLNSTNQTVREYAALAIAMSFPNDLIQFVKNGKGKYKTADKKHLQNCLSLISLLYATNATSVGAIVPKKAQDQFEADIKESGITGMFEGGSACLGLI